MIKKLKLALLLGIFCFAISPLQAALPSAGEINSLSCLNCHGTNGGGSGPISQIAGLPKDLLAKKMIAYKDGSIPATVMNRIAKGYTNEEIEEIAEYLSKL